MLTPEVGRFYVKGRMVRAGIFLLWVFSGNVAYSQGVVEESSSTLDKAVTDVYIIGGAGFTGAVLGLSTLSFVDKPKEHLNNIVAGGALGVIVGVAVVAWGQAQRPSDSFLEAAARKSVPSRELFAFERYGWHRSFARKSPSPPGLVSYHFTF